jgi:hypothetical protein
MRSFEHGATRSPFHSRTYGGLSSAQIGFLQNEVDFKKRQRILDPMAGQGSFLAELSHEGHDVTLEDINPGPLLLASLRDPELLCRAAELRAAILRKLPKRRTANTAPDYCSTWLSPCVLRDLERYSLIFGIPAHRLALSDESSFWTAPPLTRLAASLAVLAARRISCFRRSDNATWLKEGGLSQNQRLFDALKQALDEWCKYADSRLPILRARSKAGSLRLSWTDSTAANRFSQGPYNLVVTSPPYANRLDYTRLWAPELAVVGQLFSVDSSQVKERQIGTTVVRDRYPSEVAIRELPSVVQNVLSEIRSDVANKASERYYFPFFANYALHLQRAVLRTALRLRTQGTLVLFIRDTVRKDILFPAGSLVELVLCENGWFVPLAKHHQTVRHHIGLIRRDASGLYGSAQREWWLSFRKAKGCR